VNALAGIDESMSLELVAQSSRYPLATMGYVTAAAGVLALAGGAWALHVNEQPVGCGELVDVAGRCPRERSTVALGAVLVGAGAALTTLGGTWIFLARSQTAPPDEGKSLSPHAGGEAGSRGAAYLVGVGGSL